MNTKLSNPFLLLLIITGIIINCSTPEKSVILDEGIWRGTLNVQGHELPFNFEVVNNNRQYKAYLHNAEEHLLLDTIAINGDSIYIPMHIFDADIEAVITDGKLKGTWTKNYYDDYVIPFEAEYDQNYRFEKAKSTPSINFSGSWDMIFDHAGDTTIGVAVIKQSNEMLTGTILTPTGDYRYLEGQVDGDQLMLSTFDGGHAFLFTAQGNDRELKGNFWSGKSWHETWTAVKNDTAKLPDADYLTYLVDDADSIYFEFPDLEGNIIKPNDKQYEDKVLILQIFGTWCPNCMDETKFLTNWYDQNKDRGVEILGVAYEVKDDFDYAKKRVTKMKEKLNINYDFVIGGNLDKEEASKTLPMLNRISSFPTTIFIDKQGKVQRIHTGFTGPGTGLYYEQFVKEFNETVDELVGE